MAVDDPTDADVWRALRSEKDRQDGIGWVGFETARLSWEDLDSLAAVRVKVEAARARARRRPA